MAAKTLTTKIILVNKTTAEWATESTVISKGLPVIEFANNGTKMKVGDGVNTFADLPYIADDLTASAIITALGFTPADSAKVGIANGIASLDDNGKIPTAQLPSYVDDVIEVDGIDNAPETGEAGKIYVDTATGKTYRWGGTMYVEISAGDLVTASETNGYIKVNGTDVKVYTPVQADWNEPDETKPSYIANKPSIPEGSVVDATLSDTSTNAVQNKVINAELVDIKGRLDTIEGDYITSADTLVLNCTL